MNTRAKGERTKKYCSDYGDSIGYYIHNNPHLRFGTKSNYPNSEHSKDMFGLFDAIWVYKTGNKPTLFVQYSSNKFHTLVPYKEWVMNTHKDALLLVWIDRIGFKIKHLRYNSKNKKVSIYSTIL